MGNAEPSDEEINKWLTEGWKFTKRTRKGRLYITRRKGANLERSHGSFRQALWDRIKKLERKLLEPPSEPDLMSTFYDHVEIGRAGIKSLFCVHIDDERYCTYWKWTPDHDFIKFRGDLKYKTVKNEDPPLIMFPAHIRYCMGCNAYVSTLMNHLEPKRQ